MTTVVGMRVVRGPDWEGEDSDGGKECVGTVMEESGEHSVRVLWDTGIESTCKAGRDGKRDLRIFDTAPVGVRHLGETCAVCGEKDVWGMLWRCRDCDDCCLCAQCYCEDKHDVDHDFLRVDTPGSSGTTVNSRSKSLKMQAVGIFSGAKVRKVKRYKEEVYGSEGEVEGYETGVLYKCRNILRVRWSDDVPKNCCLGEIVCIEEAAGPNYYRDHLPLLDLRDLPFLEGLAMPCASELFPENNVGIASFTPSVRTDGMPGSVQHGTMMKAHIKSSTAEVHLLSAAHDVGRDLLPERVAAITVGYSKDTDDGESCWSTQPSHESITWLDKTYDTSGYNLRRNYDTEVTDDHAVTSLGTNIKQSTEDKGKFAEGLFDREATGLQCDTRSRESQLPSNLLFDLANDREKNDTVEISSDEEEKETYVKERELQVDVGDSVAIKVGESRLEELQKTHGGCTQQMKQAIGMTGSVVTKTTKGSILVEFKSLGQYPFSPEALVKVSQVKQGETVKIRPDKDQVKILNRRVGWKDEMASTLGKVGRVAKVDSDGDLLVIFGRSAFLYSPACCLPSPSEHTDSLVIAGKSITSRVTSSTSDVKDNSVQEKNKATFLKMREMVLGQSSMSFIEQDDQVHHLFRAIYNGDIETVARLCGRNMSLLASCHQQLTPLMLASTRYSQEVVELLLDLGADINAVISPNKTALGAAIEARREDICSLLIDRGADLSFLDHRKLSFVHIAAYQDMPMVIKTLAAYGVDINAKDKDKDTPLLVAVQRGAHRAMEALLSLSGIDVTTKNNRGFSALQLASQKGYARALEKMLAIDKSGVNDFYRGHSTPLHLAANTDQVESVRLLVIKGGANINLQDIRGMRQTPLHTACYKASYSVAEVLLQLGADVNVQDKQGDTPLHLAIGAHMKHDVESEAGKNECQIRVAIACMLISKGAYVDAMNREGCHPFDYGATPIREGVGQFIRKNKALVKSHQEWNRNG